MKYTILPVLLVMVIFSFCNMNKDDPVLKDVVTYTLTFKAIWGAETHPTNFPPNPHFSPLIGTTHNNTVEFWKTGKKASAGIESMAETGSTSALKKEINTQFQAKKSWKPMQGGGIGTSPGSVSMEIKASKDFPLLTMVSMLAPSPDWFTGISQYNLLDDSGNWKEDVTFDVHLYDAGTDSGENFTSADDDTESKENIKRFATGSFSGNITGTGTANDGKARTVVGTFTLKKKS